LLGKSLEHYHRSEAIPQENLEDLHAEIVDVVEIEYEGGEYYCLTFLWVFGCHEEAVTKVREVVVVVAVSYPLEVDSPSAHEEVEVVGYLTMTRGVRGWDGLFPSSVVYQALVLSPSYCSLLSPSYCSLLSPS
jgi:hypothetical protein